MRYSDSTIKKKIKWGQLSLSSVLVILALVSFLPVLLVICVAFSSESSINQNGFSFFPAEYSVKAFEYVFNFGGQLVNAYMVTIAETFFGTLLTLFFTGMFAYVLSRKNFMLNKFFTIYLLITMLFSGGMLSNYLINTNVFHLRNNFLVLVLPGCVTTWNCIVMRTFIRSNVHDALIESAKIDGAGDIYTYFKIVMPIMLPVLAAIGFMAAVTHWNEWQMAYLYIDNPKMTTLQLLLIRIEKNLQYLQQNESSLSPEQMEQLQNAPSESARMAILFFTIGPIMVAYPFFQKYFIKGITMGSVKG